MGENRDFKCGECGHALVHSLNGGSGRHSTRDDGLICPNGPHWKDEGEPEPKENTDVEKLHQI